MKILLIDDKANKGWSQLLEKVFPIKGMSFEIAIDINSALEKIKNKYDLIFIDLRLDAKDHNQNIIENFTGFKILKRIKEDFLKPNFSTPIILITASNKIWNINNFLDYGVDAYYIKEHPDHISDQETSKQNYDKLKGDFSKLIEISPRRNKIWSKSKEIIDKLDSHIYFKQDNKYKNVKSRIFDKIKLGYYYSFKNQNSVEKDVLKVDNESVAFLIYFSILEELVKGYSEKNNWNIIGEFLGRWRFRNNKDFIQTDYKSYEVEPIWEKGRYISKKFEITDSLYIKYSEGHINLSEQIYALIYHYGIEDKVKKLFKDLNEFRNKLNYTHSSINAIYYKPLIDDDFKGDLYNYINEMLELISEILNYPK